MLVELKKNSWLYNLSIFVSPYAMKSILIVLDLRNLNKYLFFIYLQKKNKSTFCLKLISIVISFGLLAYDFPTPLFYARHLCVVRI